MNRTFEPEALSHGETFKSPVSPVSNRLAKHISSGGSWMNKVLAIAGVVIKELYRRKDFYVLFVMTAVITLLMASVKDCVES